MKKFRIAETVYYEFWASDEAQAEDIVIHLSDEERDQLISGITDRFSMVTSSWEETDEDTYYEMLEVLPPAKMGKASFLVGEPLRHRGDEPVFQMFVQTGDRYWKGESTVGDFNAKLSECRTMVDNLPNYDRRDACQHCREEREPLRLPERFAEERYSFGIYAGRYCDECWPKSGYRDATDPDAEFDPRDAGETYWEDEY